MPTSPNQPGPIRQRDSEPVVYISAVQDDAAWVQRIADRIQKDGIGVWDHTLAFNRLTAERELEKSREHCSVYILFLTVRYLDSEVVRRSELPFILSLPPANARIIYVIAERCEWLKVLPLHQFATVPFDDSFLISSDEAQIEANLDLLTREVRRAASGMIDGSQSASQQSPDSPNATQAQVLEDLITQTEIFLQYSLQSKALERLQKIASLYPGEEERNERLRNLYETANWWPTRKAWVKPEQSQPPATSEAPNASSVEAPSVSDGWITQQEFDRFSVDAVEVLSRARRIRGESGMIHTGQLLQAFREHGAHGDGAEPLMKFLLANDKNIIQVTSDSPLSREVGPLLDRPTKMSDNVRNALLTAIGKAGPTGEITDSHLLFGVLSTVNNERVRTLNDRGMTADKVPIPGPAVAAAEIAGLARTISAPTPKIVSDLWAEEDVLGYGAYARTLAGVIAHEETVPPLSIGIKAPWGAGKTSLMKQLQHILDGRANITEENQAATINKDTTALSLTIAGLWKKLRQDIEVTCPPPTESKLGALYGIAPRNTVWFNAWKYQTSEQIWAGLAHCIISQVTARMTTDQRELFWLKLQARRVNKEAVRKRIYGLLLRYLAPIALLGIVTSVAAAWLLPSLGVAALWPKAVTPALTVIGLIWKGRDKLGDKAADAFKDLVREPDYEGKMGFLHLVESDIRDVLNLVATKKRPLVVFVDDLDRCVPRKVAEVVEAINLSLCGDYPNCIFVLGMESGMVAAALEVANKDVIEKAKQLSLLDTTIPLGWRFMEKIVQLPINIPPPTDLGLKAYAASLTGRGDSEEEPQEKEVEGDKPSLPAKEKIEEYKAKLEPLRNAAEVADVTKRMMEKAPQEERLAVAEASKQKYAEKLGARDPLVRKFVEDVFNLVGGNPRQIKRYINVFRFHSTLRFNFETDLEARGLKAKSPSDSCLAKFIAMAIQWPQAAEFLKRTCPVAIDGKMTQQSLLKALEKKSQTLKDQQENADAEWAAFLKNAGLGNLEWMATPTFRDFLTNGEILSEIEECGLW